MKKRFNSIPVALLLAAGLQFAAYAGSLHKIWEVDLGAEIKGPAGREQMQPGVLALRFSPDGTKIAVAGNAYQYNPPMSRLVMVQVAKPKEGIQHFDMAEIASDSEVLGIRPPAIAWSPAGDLILAGFNLIHLRDGSGCVIPNTFAGAFLGADQIVAQMPSKTGSYRLEFFDSSCKSTGAWDMGYPEWSFADASPDRALVALLRNDELVVLDPIVRKIVRSWPTSQTGYDARFGQQGKIICAGDTGEDLYEDKKVPPRCMNVDTGERIAEAPGIIGGAPLSAAAQGNRVIVSDHSHLWNVFYREYDTALKRRAVWDFAKNAIIASWRPDNQSYGPLGSKPWKDPFAFAISPDGNYVAEAGNGMLRLYKIEP